MTATTLTIEGRHYHMDETVLEQALDKRVYCDSKDLKKIRQNDLEYLINCYKATDAWKRNHMKDIKNWTNCDDIKTYLKPLKQSGESAWPSNREDYEKLYLKWIGRERRSTVVEKCVMDKFDEWMNNENEKA